MSELDFLRELDADIHAGLASAGMASEAFYTAPGANVDVRCRIMIDRGIQVRGEFDQVVGKRDEIAILRADVAEPQKRGRLLVETTPGAGSGEHWELIDLLSDDGSLSRWVARRV